MYNVVTRYVTYDGKEHRSAEEAREHVATTIKVRIKDMLHSAVTEVRDGALTVTDIYAITEILYAKRGLLQQTGNMEFHGDDGEERDDYRVEV